MDIVLHCLDHGHLKSRGLCDVFPALHRFNQVSHCASSRRIAVGAKSGSLALYELRGPKCQVMPSQRATLTTGYLDPVSASYDPEIGWRASGLPSRRRQSMPWLDLIDSTACLTFCSSFIFHPILAINQYIQAHNAEITACAFSPDGKNLASYSSSENRLSFWQVKKRNSLRLGSALHQQHSLNTIKRWI